jgi:FkbM family methyltransferase
VYRNRVVSYLVWRCILRYPKLRSWLTALLVADRDEWINLLGTNVCINRRAEIGYWRASRQQHGNVLFRDEVPTLLHILPIIAHASTFVDCGANVGLFTSVALHLQRLLPTLKIYAYEPNPATFGRLKNTTNGGDVHIENIALSNYDGILEMAAGATSGVFGVPGGSFQLRETSMKVACRRLDSCAIEGERIFLKIDVEGHEYEVIEGARGLFDANRVLGTFIDGATRERDCLEFLRAHGFRIVDGHSLDTYKAGDFRILALHDRYLRL